MGEAQPETGETTNSLGKYRLIAELGHGGMAEVFLAVSHGPAGFNKLLVIKKIRPQFAEDPEFLGMFLDEARLAARLSHPNVVQTNEVGDEHGRYFMAMEYLDGQPLNRVVLRLAKTGGLPLHLHLRILADVLAGLHHAHELLDFDGTHLGVVHRDVTPQNVFVTYDGMVKVVDFGIAKAQNSASETKAGVVKGKVAYMAPEQARGDRVDRRADVFSVGVLMWEAVTGTRLWKGMPELTIIQRLLSGEVPSPSTIKQDIPLELEAMIVRAMASNREDRYATAADFQADIEGYLETKGDRGARREMGKLLTASFEAERARIKTVIEAESRVRKAETEQGLRLPIIDQPTSIDGTSDPKAEGISSPGEGSGSNPNHTMTGGQTPFTSTTNATSASRVVPVPQRSRNSMVGAVIGVAALAVLGIWQLTKPPAAVAGGEVIGAPSNASNAKGAPTTVTIKIAATPPTAQLFLDNKPLEGNPWKGSFPTDSSTHRLRIEATGFKTRNEELTLDNDRSMDLTLTADPTLADAKTGQAPVVNPPRGNTPAADPNPAGGSTTPGTKKRRKLDDAN
ncbi:MAG: serine/threonine-protein kinase, partial [Minicystis sp.]